MITEMVIRITNANIECNSAIQFLQIILHVSTILKYEIDNIQIAMASISIVHHSSPKESWLKQNVCAYRLTFCQIAEKAKYGICR